MKQPNTVAYKEQSFHRCFKHFKTWNIDQGLGKAFTQLDHFIFGKVFVHIFVIFILNLQLSVRQISYLFVFLRKQFRIIYGFNFFFLNELKVCRIHSSYSFILPYK